MLLDLLERAQVEHSSGVSDNVKTGEMFLLHHI